MKISEEKIDTKRTELQIPAIEIDKLKGRFEKENPGFKLFWGFWYTL